MDVKLEQVKYIHMDLCPKEKIESWESAVSINLLVPERDVEKLRVALMKLLAKEK